MKLNSPFSFLQNNIGKMRYYFIIIKSDPLLPNVPCEHVKPKFLFQFKKGLSKKFYERRNCESVDE